MTRVNTRRSLTRKHKTIALFLRFLRLHHHQQHSIVADSASPNEPNTQIIPRSITSESTCMMLVLSIDQRANVPGPFSILRHHRRLMAPISQLTAFRDLIIDACNSLFYLEWSNGRSPAGRGQALNASHPSCRGSTLTALQIKLSAGVDIALQLFRFR